MRWGKDGRLVGPWIRTGVGRSRGLVAWLGRRNEVRRARGWCGAPGESTGAGLPWNRTLGEGLVFNRSNDGAEVRRREGPTRRSDFPGDGITGAESLRFFADNESTGAGLTWDRTTGDGLGFNRPNDGAEVRRREGPTRRSDFSGDGITEADGLRVFRRKRINRSGVALEQNSRGWAGIQSSERRSGGAAARRADAPERPSPATE
ncbi:MAG: hypothetical protein IPN19_11945 [Elusimicrobia bacterium]|nr:hypothetical protein [Elusimicrobiota bacterium]